MTHTPTHTPKALKYLTTLMVTLFFIGTMIPSTIAQTTAKKPTADPPQLNECCTTMIQIHYTTGPNTCDSCKEAVEYAVDYMIDYVKTNVRGIYFLHTVDVSILIFNGLIEGFQASGYHMEIDTEQMKQVIDYWVDTLVGKQIFPVTTFLAKFGSIAIGITDYLIHLCNGEDITNTYTTQVPPRRPLVKIWTLVLQILGL